MRRADAESPALVVWLKDRLREERLQLERRHQDICEALLLELSSGGQHHEHLPPKPTPVSPPALSPTSANTPHPNLCDEDAQESCATTPALPPTPSSMRTQPSKLRGADTAYTGSSRLKRIVLGSRFEMTFGVLILMNAVIMALEVQHDGLIVGEAYGSEDTFETIKLRGLAGWPHASQAFRVFEWVFGSLFTVELILKLIAQSENFVRDLWNFFDSIIVGFWLISSFGDVVKLPMNPMVLRVCRLVRLLRLLRLAKMSTMFDVLVLMISSVQASGAVLLWGMVLLFMFMTIGAFILSSLLEDVMNPETSLMSPDKRDQIYRLFGTYTLSMITMFEITMASWVSTCRLLVDNVGEGYAIFFIFYKCVVGFAVLKVITGVFLHETFKCASLDDDLMIQNRRRMRNKFKSKMCAFFHAADVSTTADGEVSCEEFVEMLKDERVNTWLEAMDLRIRDVGADRIFAFLAGPDMSLSLDELCSGMSRLRGAAQGLDVVTLLEIAKPEIKMPLSKDVIRLIGSNDQVSPQTALGASVPTATDMRRAAAELCDVAADLRSALGGGATAVHHVGRPLLMMSI